MTDTHTARDFYVDVDEPITASGEWEYVPTPPSQGEWVLSRAIAQTLKHAGLAALLAASPMTAGVDPWFIDRRHRMPMTLEETFETILGRPISAIEARNLALQILARAEERRRQFADEEARRGFDLEFDL